jgi:hypothetical protein
MGGNDPSGIGNGKNGNGNMFGGIAPSIGIPGIPGIGIPGIGIPGKGIPGMNGGNINGGIGLDTGNDAGRGKLPAVRDI